MTRDDIDLFGYSFKRRTLVLTVLFGPVALWLAWGLGGAWIFSKIWRSNTEQGLASLGQTGDLFGGINALFAAYAFAGVGVAAFFQRETFLLVQRQQIAQSFEPLFFQLLQRHKALHVLHAVDGAANAEPEYFSDWMIGFKNKLNTSRMIAEMQEMTVEDRLAAVEQFYEPIYDKNQSVLGPYFRSLYHVFKLIASSQLSEGERINYANIARASLNNEELALIAVNCATHFGREFKPLIESYGILKHLTTSDADSEGASVLVSHMYSPTATMSSAERTQFWGLDGTGMQALGGTTR